MDHICTDTYNNVLAEYGGPACIIRFNLDELNTLELTHNLVLISEDIPAHPG